MIDVQLIEQAFDVGAADATLPPRIRNRAAWSAFWGR
jgi:hypothetical protein